MMGPPGCAGGGGGVGRPLPKMMEKPTKPKTAKPAAEKLEKPSKPATKKPAAEKLAKPGKPSEEKPTDPQFLEILAHEKIHAGRQPAGGPVLFQPGFCCGGNNGHGCLWMCGGQSFRNALKGQQAFAGGRKEDISPLGPAQHLFQLR